MTDPLSRRSIVIACTVLAALVVGVVVLSRLMPEAEPVVAKRTGPVAVVPVEAPAAGSPECAALITALPKELTSNGTTLRSLAIAEPAPQAVAAWGADTGDPVVLRCGLPKPAELIPTSELREVSGVKWLAIVGDLNTSFYLVDRAVHAALTVPKDSGTGPLQTISETIGKTLPPVAVKP